MPDCQNIPNNKPLTKHQLLKYLQDIEWDNFEVKTAKTDVPKDVWETVSAFSNSSGGWIVFGVSRIKKNGIKSGTITRKSGTVEQESGTITKESGTKIKTVDKIIDLISKDNSISITQLSTTTNITRSTIQKHINNLKNKGIIRREGAGKGGKWIIIKD